MYVERHIFITGELYTRSNVNVLIGNDAVKLNVILDICGNTIVVKGADTACKLCGSKEDVSELKICSSCIRKINVTKIQLWACMQVWDMLLRAMD